MIDTIKEIKTTDSFHELREDQKNCQTVESLESCETRQLLKSGERACGCIPYELGDFSHNKTFHVNIFKR